MHNYRFDPLPKLTMPLLGIVILSSQSISAETYGGIEFLGGSSSFVDRVVSYEPSFGGGPIPSGQWLDEKQVIGIPNSPNGCCEVSLGNGGRITVQFVDNALTGSNDDAPDIHIFESGDLTEDTFVAQKGVRSFIYDF